MIFNPLSFPPPKARAYNIYVGKFAVDGQDHWQSELLERLTLIPRLHGIKVNKALSGNENWGKEKICIQANNKALQALDKAQGQAFIMGSVGVEPNKQPTFISFLNFNLSRDQSSESFLCPTPLLLSEDDKGRIITGLCALTSIEALLEFPTNTTLKSATQTQFWEIFSTLNALLAEKEGSANNQAFIIRVLLYAQRRALILADEIHLYPLEPLVVGVRRWCQQNEHLLDSYLLASLFTEIGICLKGISTKSLDRQLALEAVEALENAEKHTNGITSPRQWLVVKNDLGMAFRYLGQIFNDPSYFERALSVLNRIRKHPQIQKDPIASANAIMNIANINLLLAKIKKDPGFVNVTIFLYNKAIKLWERTALITDKAYAINNLANAYEILAGLTNDPSLYQRALLLYREAITFFSPASHHYINMNTSIERCESILSGIALLRTTENNEVEDQS